MNWSKNFILTLSPIILGGHAILGFPTNAANQQNELSVKEENWQESILHVANYLKGFTKDNPFDFKNNFSTKNHWNDLILGIIRDLGFQGYSRVFVRTIQWKDDAQKDLNGHLGAVGKNAVSYSSGFKYFNISLPNSKESFKLKFYFKNIDTLPFFLDLRSNLMKFNWKNPFDLKSQISMKNTWSDVVEKINDHLLNVGYFKNYIDSITWTNLHPPKKILDFKLMDDTDEAIEVIGSSILDKEFLISNQLAGCSDCMNWNVRMSFKNIKPN